MSTMARRARRKFSPQYKAETVKLVRERGKTVGEVARQARSDGQRSAGAPLHQVTEGDLSELGIVFQIGVAPVRIDILTSLFGPSFSEARESRSEAFFDRLKLSGS